MRESYGTCLAMAWPSALESMLVAVMTTVDTMMVGTVGTAAISAVGVTGQPRHLMMLPVIALNTGVTAVVARRKGEGDLEGACRALKQALQISAAFCLLMAILSCFLAAPLVRLMGADAEYFASAVDYFRIIMAGQAFGSLGMTVCAAQRGVGNTRISMLSNGTGNIVNIIFNYFLINGVWGFPRLEVRGAAIATALGSIVAFTMAAASVLRGTGAGAFHGMAHLRLLGEGSGPWRFQKKTLGSIYFVSSSAAVEQFLLRVGLMIYASLAVRLGTVSYATHQIVMSLLNVSFAIGDGFGIAGTSLVGQSLGARRRDLAMMYGLISQRCAMVLGVLLCVLLALFRLPILSAYTDDPAVLQAGSGIMLILSAISLIQPTQVVATGCLRGAGDSKFVAVSSFISMAFVRTLISYVLCYPLGLGLLGIWFGLLFDQFLRMVLNLGRFYGGKWMNIEL